MRWKYIDLKGLEKTVMHLIKYQRLIKSIRDKFHSGLT